jgi:hypothetical protein
MLGVGLGLIGAVVDENVDTKAAGLFGAAFCLLGALTAMAELDEVDGKF